MIITIEVLDYELFNKLVEEIKIMLPIYPYSKPYIDNVDWRSCKIQLATDGEYYHIFISMLKKYIIDGIVKISMNLPLYPIIAYNPNNSIPTEDWLITIE